MSHTPYPEESTPPKKIDCRARPAVVAPEVIRRRQERNTLQGGAASRPTSAGRYTPAGATRPSPPSVGPFACTTTTRTEHPAHLAGPTAGTDQVGWEGVEPCRAGGGLAGTHTPSWRRDDGAGAVDRSQTPTRTPCGRAGRDCAHREVPAVDRFPHRYAATRLYLDHGGVDDSSDAGRASFDVGRAPGVALVDVLLADPPGARSCGEGGSWQCCRAPGRHNTNYWMAEFEALSRQCSRADGRLVKAELRKKMRAAELGALDYGPDRDVIQMRVCPIVLEIRVRRNVGAEDGNRVVRLYFSEPAHVDGMILAAKLGWKHPLGKAEQDAHAEEAGERVRNFFL